MPRRLKSADVLQLEKGKLYGDQRDRTEIQPGPKKEIKPRCPKHFTKAEKKQWRYFRDILKNYGLFEVANAVHLEFLAANMVQYLECQKRVAATGLLVKGQQGGVQPNPYWNAVNKLEDKILRVIKELGLSTEGIAKVGSLAVKAKKEKSEMEKLLD